MLIHPLGALLDHLIGHSVPRVAVLPGQLFRGAHFYSDRA